MSRCEAGSPDAIDAYESHGRVVGGSRDEMLDALYGAWRKDVEEGKASLMIAADLATVSELNVRAQADRIAAGSVAGEGVTVSGGATAGVGDQVVTRQNNRHLSTGAHWVRNGDQWRVTDSHGDGSLTLQRRHGTGKVHVQAEYVRQHVELAYASTAHRAQGRTLDTAHAMVGPGTTKEVLYVSATRGREANCLYVDTHYDPDPLTSHDEAMEPMTAKEVLVGVLRNEGAEVAAHEAIRRAQDEAEGMERLSAEYLTLATEAQAQRWDALLARSGLSADELTAVTASAARGPLFAGLRDAEARGLDVEGTLPRLVSGKSLADATDVASVLHSRVDRWSHAGGGRRRPSGQLIAGLVPRAQGVTDPDMARALFERDQAMERRGSTARARGDYGGTELAAAARILAERTRPARSLATRGLDRRGLPGPLAHRGSAPPRRGSGSSRLRTNSPAQAGSGGGTAGEGDQHADNGPTEHSWDRTGG